LDFDEPLLLLPDRLLPLLPDRLLLRERSAWRLNRSVRF
jgi:hypothetical protein